MNLPFSLLSGSSTDINATKVSIGADSDISTCPEAVTASTLIAKTDFKKKHLKIWKINFQQFFLKWKSHYVNNMKRFVNPALKFIIESFHCWYGLMYIPLYEHSNLLMACTREDCMHTSLVLLYFQTLWQKLCKH